MEDIFTCNICKTQFKHKSSLINHSKKAKYCLNIKNNKIEEKKFICEYCEIEFKTKHSLNSHFLICRKKDIYDTKIQIQKKYLEELETLKLEHIKHIETLKLEHIKHIETLKLEHLRDMNKQENVISELKGKIQIYERDHNVISDIAKQTKIINTNNTHNIVNNMSIYDINGIKEKLANTTITKNHVMNGQIGIADVIAPYLVDENGIKMITCTDIPRLSFTKIDEHKNRIKDHELKNLATDIKPIALQKADEIIEEHNKLRDKIYEIKSLECDNKDLVKFIKKFEDDMNNYIKTSSIIKSKVVDEYQNKIEYYKQKIIKNKEFIDDYKDISNIDIEIIDDENEKLIDGHTEIKQLDLETSKFARRITKLI